GRAYKAVNDYVRFNSGTATGDVQMQVGGFSTDSLRVYDVTDPDGPVRVTIDPAHVIPGSPVAFEMQDTVAAGVRREYLAPAIQDPPHPAFGPRTPPASPYTAVP